MSGMSNHVGTPNRAHVSASKAALEGSFEVFNLLNHANFGSYVTAEVSPLYGQPQQNFNAAYLPRMLQLGFRASF